MSLYADYLKERTTDHILETPSGFASYRYVNEGKTVYIVDIYVVPEERKSGRASALADEIIKEAKLKGCSEVLGSVQPSTKNSTDSLKVLLAYGFELFNAGQDFIFLKKKI